MQKFILAAVALFFCKLIDAQNVGVGTNSPTQKIEVQGKIKVADDAQTPTEGTIRWNSMLKDFEGYTGTAWVSLTKAGAPTLGDGSSGPVTNFKNIFPSDLSANKSFGYSVDIDTNYAIIGAIGSGTRGEAYVFTKLVSGAWQQQAKLLPDVGDNIGTFGYRVSIYGEYATVSDFYQDNGVNNISQVYVFKRTGTTWAKQALLNEVSSTSGAAAFNNFGFALDMDSTHIVIGAPQHNLQAGAAFVYQRTGTTWSAPVSLTHQLTNAGGTMNFGTAVSLYNNEIIVGSPNEGDYTGATANTPLGRVYLYRKQTGVWNTIFDIMPGNYGNNPASTAPPFTTFGTSIALYDRYMVVSAPDDNSIYFYGNDGTGEIRFGYSNIKAVSMYKDKAAILAGSKIYVHKRVGSTWDLYAFYKDPDNGVPESCAIWKNDMMMGIPSFYKCSGPNCFNTGKVSFATIE